MAPKCEPLCRFDDRLYFTTFPHPPPKQETLNNPSSQLEQVNVRGICTPPCESLEPTKHYYFTIDDQLMYMSFFQDWGPLNVAMVYKACIFIHSLLIDEDLASHRLILYTSDDPQRKANAALLISLFSLIVQQRAPWEAFQPIAELEFMPFRDAGRGRSDFNLSIQDCLWGMYKAMQNGLCDLNEFDISEYEFYEKVENGDWNWISPHFIALASPMDPAWIKNQKDAAKEQGALISPAKGVKQRELALQRKLPTPFQNCIDYFEQHNIKIVIRLNNPLYDRQTFLDRGINHMELYFDDGTNPSDEIVRRFIDISDEIIQSGGVVAVHCKAGLGRTGTLIGAYLIWKYGFTASEAIAFMRIVRPGCVVGPQQQFMYVKQLEWVKWAAADEMRRTQAAATLAAATIVAPVTPPAETDTENVPMDTAPIVAGVTTVPPVTPSKHVAAASAHARAAAPPGQPRKTPNAKRLATDSSDDEAEDEREDVLPALGAALPLTRHKSRVPPKTGVTKHTASEQRPTRVTRSAAAAACRPGKVLSTAANKANVNAPPNKIPRLANATSVRVPQKVPNLPGPAPAPRRTARPASPSPSRLPTLVPKRPRHGHHPSVSNLGDVTLKVPGHRANANEWMKNGVNAVVKPGNSKGERPGLRKVRRRRSSFSAADVVA